MLVYAVWIIVLGVKDRKKWIQLKSYYPLIFSFLFCALVFIPWQFYIFFKYPLEAAYEFKLNGQHFFHAIERHDGNVWFHLQALKSIYAPGDAIPFVFAFSVFLFLKKIANNTYRIAIASAILITYVFYTLAATKMVSFCIIVAPFGFLALAELTNIGLNFLQRRIKFKKVEIFIRFILLCGSCFLLMDMNRIEDMHADNKPNVNYNRKKELEQMSAIEKINKEISASNTVVFNAAIRKNGHIALMFYTDFIAYNFIPSEMQIREIKKQSCKVAILDDNQLPEFILQDPSIRKIKLSFFP
jgi:hypothetical protein